MAKELLDAMKDARIQVDAQTYNSALRTYSSCGLFEQCLSLIREMESGKLKINSETGSKLIQSCNNFGQNSATNQLLIKLSALGLTLENSVGVSSNGVEGASFKASKGNNARSSC